MINRLAASLWRAWTGHLSTLARGSPLNEQLNNLLQIRHACRAAERHADAHFFAAVINKSQRALVEINFLGATAGKREANFDGAAGVRVQ